MEVLLLVLLILILWSIQMTTIADLKVFLAGQDVKIDGITAAVLVLKGKVDALKDLIGDEDLGVEVEALLMEVSDSTDALAVGLGDIDAEPPV